jgi:hypothetical protein
MIGFGPYSYDVRRARPAAREEFRPEEDAAARNVMSREGVGPVDRRVKEDESW